MILSRWRGRLRRYLYSHQQRSGVSSGEVSELRRIRHCRHHLIRVERGSEVVWRWHA